MRIPRSRNQRSDSSSNDLCHSCDARSVRTRRRNSAAMRSGGSPSDDSDWRRVCRGRGSIASIDARRKRRWPPGVVNTSILPPSAQRRSVSGSTPRMRLASPSVSQSPRSIIVLEILQI